MTENFEVFPHAPIEEAVIDIAIEPRDGICADDMSTIFKNIESDYPDKWPVSRSGVEVNITNDVATTSHQRTQLGFVYKGGNKMLLAKPDGLAVSFLRPYPKWETFAAEAQRAWVEYKNFCKPQTINRLGVRYINRFIFNSDGIDEREFFNLGAKVPQNLQYPLTNFRSESHIVFAPDVSGILRFSTAHPDDPNKVGFMLDIDVFCNFPMPADDRIMWEKLETFRKLKNEIFLGSLTDKGKEHIR